MPGGLQGSHPMLFNCSIVSGFSFFLLLSLISRNVLFNILMALFGGFRVVVSQHPSVGVKTLFCTVLESLLWSKPTHRPQYVISVTAISSRQQLTA